MSGSNFYRKVLQALNLQPELDDYEKIHDTIQKDVIFKGTNLWILVFAILVASVGLNMNSTAVIIGAMLISPLMGPIIGMGYSIATYNFELLRKAIKNFSFAVIASLIASTLYFTISPISTAHSELLARTSPTIYDVLIALFGGLAGIVAISSKQKGNVIPGVAIATALMPPLCTAGYGLATAQFNFFFGAFYLFTINTVFIALASMLISQMLRFPIRQPISEKQKKTVNRIITSVIIIVLFPSVYFGYLLVQKERFVSNATEFVRNVSFIGGNYLLKNEIDPDTRTIKLIYGGSGLTDKQQSDLKSRTETFSIQGAVIDIQQGLSFDEISSKNSEIENMRIEISHLNMMLRDKKAYIDSLTERPSIGKKLLGELQSLYPEITQCIYADASLFNDTLKEAKPLALVILKSGETELNSDEQKKITSWVRARLGTKSAKVMFE